MAKQYHYTVVVEVDDSGEPTSAYLDDGDSGYFPDGHIYEPNENDPWNEWHEALSPREQSEDVDAASFLADVLARGQAKSDA